MRDSSLGPLLAVFYGCGFLAGFNENLVNMALVAIMGDFSIDAVAAQWLVTGYMIAVTVVVTCMAYLYRRLSMRTLFFAAAALSIAGSAGGFLAPNFPLLLVARLVQAVGTGVFIPLMMNVIVDRVPHGRLGTYLAIGSAMITIGPATAPIVTGFMVSDLGWRSVFLVPLAAAVALTVAGIFVVRGGREPERARFDLPSALLTAAGVTLLCVGLSEVTLRPAVGAAALIGAALALGWFARRQEHLARPLVSMEPLHHGMFWPAALLVMVTMMTYFSLSVMAPLYFEEAAGLAASMAGVLMVAPVLANAAASVLSGRALDRWGEWPLLPAGLAIAVAGLGITIAGALAGSVVVATAGIFFGYLGTGMVLSPAQTAGLRRLPEELDSHGVTLMSMAVQLSACLGPAAYVGIMGSATAAASAAGAPAAQASAEGFAGAMIAALVVAAAGLVTAVFYARFTKRRPL
ncbi:MAG: MFS transporter [Adlercreutzia equolifaciens]|uniref:MFS transporter n=1 Tax=Adlercreutzia equolifaciens TaxID=446660 RepID=UPI00242D0DB7|nr:MFS transporter [Adlercreutzia equolifaciens]MBS5741842.1 MFS transporter [Adlercreutzia equolifaciens]MED9826688.1 MFS transporter [Adlercreutzia sp.]HJI13226.1 MFS transporter [Adlercreutzia equolifaciens]